MKPESGDNLQEKWVDRCQLLFHLTSLDELNLLDLLGKTTKTTRVTKMMIGWTSQQRQMQTKLPERNALKFLMLRKMKIATGYQKSLILKLTSGKSSRLAKLFARISCNKSRVI